MYSPAQIDREKDERKRKPTQKKIFTTYSVLFFRIRCFSSPTPYARSFKKTCRITNHKIAIKNGKTVPS
jgi:hypothetical protein